MLDRLNELFGQDRSREDDYRDFERRYREQPEQISDREAARRYREIMARVGDIDDDEEVGREYEQAFSRMSPEERRALAKRYQEATRDNSRSYQGYRDDYDLDRASSPRELGRMTRRAAQEDPDLLEQLLGQNSPLSGTAGKMALAGLAALMARRFLDRR